MKIRDCYQKSTEDFYTDTRYYLDTPFGQVKMFVEKKKTILQFFPSKDILEELRKKENDRFSKTHPFCSYQCDYCSNGKHSMCITPSLCHDTDEPRFWIDLD